MNFRSLLLLGLASMVPASMAGTYVIDFDKDSKGAAIAEGATLNSQYDSWGISWESSPLDPADGWASTTDLTITKDDVGWLTGQTGNLVHSFGGWLGEDGDADFAMLYDGSLGKLISVSADFLGDSDGLSLFAAYHWNGASYDLLGTSPQTVGEIGNETLSFSDASGIDAIIFAPGDFDDWVGVDNITLTVQAVPEPTTMAVLGLGLVGIASKRRRQ